MNNQSELSEQILALEEKLLHPDIRKSIKDLNSMLAEDFIELGSSGRIYNKEQVIDLLPILPVLKMVIKDFQIKILSPGIVLAIYSLAADTKKEELIERSLRSSIWILKEGVWRIVFHQGTSL